MKEWEMVAPGHDKATSAWWSVIEGKQAGPGGQPTSWGLHGYTSQFHQIEENRGEKFEGEETEGSLTMGRLGKQGKWPALPLYANHCWTLSREVPAPAPFSISHRFL